MHHFPNPNVAVADPIKSATNKIENVDQIYHSEQQQLWIDILISSLLVLPLLLTAYLPLLDLPNHLARQHVFSEWSSTPHLQRYYYYKIALVPNLILDVFVLIVRYVTSIELAIRLFCIILLLLLFWGCRMINRQLGGRQSRIYRVVPLLCYGGPFQFGFLSFCFGIGLALVYFGAYLRERDSSRFRLVAIFAPLSFVLLLCHLAAFGLAAVAIAAFELSHSYDRFTGDSLSRLLRKIARREARVALFLPPFLLFVALSPTTSVVGHSAVWSLRSKADGLAALTLFSSPGPELTLLGLAAAGLIFALITDTVRARRETAAIAIAMGIVFLLLPRVALSGGYIDYRIPWAASFFVIATLVPGRRTARYGMPLGVWFGGLVAARLALIAALWLSWDPVIAGIVSALRTLPTGARLMAVEGDPGSTSVARSPPLVHVAAYAVAYRQAYWPGMFASFSGQILYFQPAYKHLWQPISTELTHLDPMYNYVLVLRPTFVHVSPALPLRCIAHGDSFELFAVTVGSGYTRCSR